MTGKIRIITINGWWDQDRPADFHLPTYVMGVRAAGYLLSDDVYVSAQWLVSVIAFDDARPPQAPTMPPSGSVLQ